MRPIYYILIACAIGAFETSFAQSGDIEEVVVTGSYARNNFFEMPAVTYRSKADFLVQSVRIVNDSRSPDVRRTEIIETLNWLITASEQSTEIEVSYGNGFIEPIKLDDESLLVIDDRDRIDNSYVNIYVKIATSHDVDSTQQISKLRNFIANSVLVGRSETLVIGDIGLSIIEPEQYRYTLLKLIAEENRNIISAVESDCTTTVTGLENRLRWQRSGVDELTLFIPYSSTISCN